ncbi:MAG: hypothetical protein MZW92_53355 [Comamonadaceae bacterium]|nr:hypothetical protein [Comamonadaceae bacterium]
MATLQLRPDGRLRAVRGGHGERSGLRRHLRDRRAATSCCSISGRSAPAPLNVARGSASISYNRRTSCPRTTATDVGAVVGRDLAERPRARLRLPDHDRRRVLEARRRRYSLPIMRASQTYQVVADLHADSRAAPRGSSGGEIRHQQAGREPRHARRAGRCRSRGCSPAPA